MRLIDVDKILCTTPYLNDLYRNYGVEAIPVEWVKKYLHKLRIISKDNVDLGEEGFFGEVVAIENMLYAWEKENVGDKT